MQGGLRFDDDSNEKAGLLPVHLQSCHTNLNENGSFISDENMEKSLSTFKNRPILAYIHEVDGQPEFYSHNMHEDENGDVVYDEVPIGIVPESCNAKIVYDEEKDKNYVEVDGYIFEEYSKAAEILQREQECAVSVELSINELSYNAKEKYLEIEDFFFSGVTILGKTPSGQPVNPGMQGANIRLSDFEEKNNSLFSNYSEQISEMQEKLDTLLSHFDNKNSKEGGNIKNMFEKLLEKYGKTVEDITFEYDGLQKYSLRKILPVKNRHLQSLLSFLIVIFAMLYIIYYPRMKMPTMNTTTSTMYMTIISHTKVGVTEKSTVRNILKMKTMFLLQETDIHFTENS